jgi:ATP-dependent RNA helicase RhlE
MHFTDLKLIEPLLRAVQQEGYDTPTPIQQQAIPHVLAGRDLLGAAQTGTGKTAAFALPILQHLVQNPRPDRPIRVLVLAPTRELATQIGESFSTYGKYTPVKQVTVFGGVGQTPQVERLQRRPEVLVAAPGRLLDLMNQGYIKLDKVEIFVLDEADRMLDMGFIHDVRKVVAALPRQRQTLLFSATMPDEIRDLAEKILRDPVSVAVTPVASTVDTIQQSVYFVPKKEKPALLRMLLADASMQRVIVFTRTKHGANKVVEQLERGGVKAAAIHGNKSQSARERALEDFKSGANRVLVATDIAARGIDVDDITHVINYEFSHEPETYVHRIGRTARAGASGTAYTFVDPEEVPMLRQIEKLIRKRIPVRETPANLPVAPLPPLLTSQPQSSGQRSFGTGRPQGQMSARQSQPLRSSAPSGERGTRPAPAQPSRIGDSQNGDAPGKKRRRRRSRRPAAP